MKIPWLLVTYVSLRRRRTCGIRLSRCAAGKKGFQSNWGPICYCYCIAPCEKKRQQIKPGGRGEAKPVGPFLTSRNAVKNQKPTEKNDWWLFTEYWLFCSCSDRPKHQTSVRNSKSTFVCSALTKLSWICRKIFLGSIVTRILVEKRRVAHLDIWNAFVYYCSILVPDAFAETFEIKNFNNNITGVRCPLF